MSNNLDRKCQLYSIITDSKLFWIRVPPNLRDEWDPEGKLEKPDIDFEVEWVYGYRGRDASGGKNIYQVTTWTCHSLLLLIILFILFSKSYNKNMILHLAANWRNGVSCCCRRYFVQFGIAYPATLHGSYKWYRMHERTSWSISSCCYRPSRGPWPCELYDSETSCAGKYYCFDIIIHS